MIILSSQLPHKYSEVVAPAPCQRSEFWSSKVPWHLGRHVGWKVVKGVGVLACQLVVLNVEFFREVTCTAELQGIKV